MVVLKNKLIWIYGIVIIALIIGTSSILFYGGKNLLDNSRRIENNENIVKNLNNEELEYQGDAYVIVPINPSIKEVNINENDIGWKIYGTITNNNGMLLAGAKVNIKYYYNNNYKSYKCPCLYSDNEGKYEVFIQTPNDISYMRYQELLVFTFEITTTHVNHYPLMKKIESVPFYGNNCKEYELNFVLETGVFAYGYVIDLNFNVVKDASITIYRESKNGKVIAKTDDNGFYQFPIDKSISCRLKAIKIGKGMSSSLLYELSNKNNQKIEDFILEECGSIKGMVIDQDNLPINDIYIDFIQEKHHKSSFRNIMLEISNSFYDILSDHNKITMSHGITKTDKNGYFEVSGLEYGKYFCFIRNSHKVIDNDSKLYETGNHNAIIQLYKNKLMITVFCENNVYLENVRLLIKDCTRQQKIEYTSNGTKSTFINPGRVNIIASTLDGLLSETEIVVGEHEYKKEVKIHLNKIDKNIVSATLRFINELGINFSKHDNLKIYLIGNKYYHTYKINNSELYKNNDVTVNVIEDIYSIVIKPYGKNNYYLRDNIKCVNINKKKPNVIDVKLRRGGKLGIILSNNQIILSELKLVLWKNNNNKYYFVGMVDRYYSKETNDLFKIDKLNVNELYTYYRTLEYGNYKIDVHYGEEKI